MGVMERLRSGDLVVLDGATGTELEVRGSPQSSDASWAECSVTNPDIVRSVHEDYVRSGADVITTNTYSTGPHVLRQIGRGDAVAPWNSASVAIARDAISGAAGDREVLVAGSVSAFGNGAMRYPSMDGKFTWGEDDPDRLGANFHEQIAILVEAGVDLVLLEFLGATADDIEIGLGRALAFDVPVVASLSAAVDGEGRAVLTTVTPQSDVGRTGTTAAEAVRRIAPSGVTAICAMHSEIDETETILPAIRLRMEWSHGRISQPYRILERSPLGLHRRRDARGLCPQGPPLGRTGSEHHRRLLRHDSRHDRGNERTAATRPHEPVSLTQTRQP